MLAEQGESVGVHIITLPLGQVFETELLHLLPAQLALRVIAGQVRNGISYGRILMLKEGALTQ